MQVIDDILEKDRMLGNLAKESVDCYNNSCFLAALVCLFLMIEQAIKFSLDETNGNFKQLTKSAYESEIISSDEFDMIEKLRVIRNKMFHENYYSQFIENDDIFYPVIESETRQMIFEYFSPPCFSMVLSILDNKK